MAADVRHRERIVLSRSSKDGWYTVLAFGQYRHAFERDSLLVYKSLEKLRIMERT